MRIFSVLLAAVVASSAGAATYFVSPSGKDTDPGTSALPWKTLQHAAATLMPGDTVMIGDGTYPAPVEPARGGTAGAPITYLAVHPGVPILEGSGNTNATNRDAFFISFADYTVVDGLTIQNAYRAAVRIDSSNHVTIRRCHCLHDGTWGIFSDYSDDTLLEYNECAFSGAEHGVYLSNSGDRPIVRYNVAHDNHASGIQINADPDEQDDSLGTRGDGITDGADIESNICYNNGTSGGSAINLASVRNSRIVNNLIYNNLAGGIVGWDNDNGQDDPTSFGSKNDLVLHNTIVFKAGQGRWCVSFKNGSTNTQVYNNILVGGSHGGLETDNDSSYVSDYNILRSLAGAYAATNEDDGDFLSLTQWQSMSGNDLHSLTTDPLFVNAAANDYHLQATSPAVDAGVNRPDVTVDLDGVPRPQGAKWDMGAYELPVAVVGDVDGNGVFNGADPLLALKIAGGLIPATPGNASRGHIATGGPLSLPDAVALTRKLLGL